MQEELEATLKRRHDAELVAIREAQNRLLYEKQLEVEKERAKREADLQGCVRSVSVRARVYGDVPRRGEAACRAAHQGAGGRV